MAWRVIEEEEERAQEAKSDRRREGQGDMFSGVADDESRRGGPGVGKRVAGVESGRRWRGGGLASGPPKAGLAAS